MAWNKTYSNIYFELHGVNLDFWRNWIRPRILELKGNKCEECSSDKRLVLHHEDYDKQILDNLKILCFVCHNQLHRELGVVK